MKRTKDRGITLVALIVTIIILLILVGIAIGTLGGENGLVARTTQSKEKYAIAEAKENLEIEITNLQIEEQKKGEELTKETLTKLNNEKITVKDITNFPVEVIYNKYKFKVDENFKVVYIGEANETIITYTTKPEGYTNQDSIKLTVKISNSKGIRTIEFPDGGIVDCLGSKEYAKDFSNIVNGTYKYKVIDIDGNETTKEILIDKIDKLPPKDFTVNIGNVGTRSINITIDVEDSEEKDENVKSGMEKYEYYIKKTSSGTYTKYESNEQEYKYKELSKDTSYDIYVVAYDKAGNKNQTEITTVSTKANNSIDKILLTPNGFINSYEEDSQTGKMVGTLDKTISYNSATFQGRWSWRTIAWGQDTYYNYLYNAFDKDITTKTGFARSGIDGTNSALGDMGGYVFVEEECIGKYLNVYNSESYIKFIYRNSNFDEISSSIICTNSNKNKISSMLIPENTKFIEMYYTSNMGGGIRGMVSEIFLTDEEIQDTQSIKEFINN